MATLKLNDIIARVIDKKCRQCGKESATTLVTKACEKTNKGNKTIKHCIHYKRTSYDKTECWQLHPKK
jgi:hypothetical protein